MPENSVEPESLAIRRKRLRYRSWHRGTKELDLLLGSFADRHLETFDSGQLARFEVLLDSPEPTLLAWLVDGVPPPANIESDVLRLLLAHKLD
jgi:antitoxin CptB